MEEFIAAEKRYMRELKTLVDDVIPVLLSTVLERADNHVAARQFGAGALSGKLVNPTRPIVDMGIALERIKRLHEGIPKQDSDKLLRWAQDGKNIYEEYLRAWRMGFQDVIVTMAPAEADCNLDASGWDAESRRQLVSRLGSIDDIRHSSLAETCAVSYHALVTAARKKVTDEKARIEDEAAASIDVSKAFDIHSFAPMPNIALNPARKVRARDCFIMHMPHSSGQIMQRNVEFILRDEGAKERGTPRDSEVLICEVPVIGRLEKWLLFQPIPLKSLSARTGDDVGEIVVMVRGRRGGNPEWREVMVLKTTNDMAAFEWVQMLGLLPVPPADPFEKFRAPLEEVPPKRSRGPELSGSSARLQGQKSQSDKSIAESVDPFSYFGHDNYTMALTDTHPATRESRCSARKTSAGSRARSATPPSRQNTITPLKAKSKSRDEPESESEDPISEHADPREDLAAYPEPTLEIDQGRKRIVKAPITPIPEESEVSTTSPKQRKTSSQPSEASIKPPPAVYKGLAHIFSWSANAWQKFHPDECRIIVTSGRIEAYPNLAGSTNPTPNVEPTEGIKQLIMAPDAAPAVLSLELAPTTPIRRGTAVDLSIRTSPSSQFCGNSVMFRCRTPGECEALYNAINSARVSNATYHPLPNVQNKYHSYLDPDGAPIHPPVQVKRGWSWGRSGYRAGSSKAPSIISSEGSVGSLSSAFSVFKRFGFGKGSSGGSSFGSFASETSTASSLPGLINGLPGVPGGPISMSGLKIRLYKRETASKWRDLGPARLSILKPPIPERSNRVPEEKRIVVRDKSGKVVLLDETLGEQCFERVARTGIAVSILVGELGADGQKGISEAGGLGSKNTVYMLQVSLFNSVKRDNLCIANKP
ncbi:hypothetical protein EV426DRAFT_531047 [Tirmania nivea]|nr:hypothetical protein EV426DRAFT_531047 [Tirmania nivea]